jgi:hypothetical protein
VIINNPQPYVMFAACNACSQTFSAFSDHGGTIFYHTPWFGISGVLYASAAAGTQKHINF